MNGTAELRTNEWTTQVSPVRMSYSEDVAEQDAILAALDRRYRGRGFANAAKEHEQQMDAMEEEARATSPAYYRRDELCANGRGDRFRNATHMGRRVMDVEGFAAYFSECRAGKVAAEESAPCAVTAPARTREQSRIARATGNSIVATRKTPEQKTEQVMAFAKQWLRPDDPGMRRVGHKRRLPVALISVFAVFAASLMLIVSGSVMVAEAKRDAADAQDRAAALKQEAQLAQDKLEAGINYLEVYETATEEYGMIPVSQTGTVYLENTAGNTIEVVESEEETPGLSTLLSAIGIHIGS